MIPPTFPRTQGAISQESYLTLVLLAMLEQAGGELRISSQSLEKVDSGGKLLIDWDVPSQQLVIRAASPSLVIAQVRGTGWTTQPAAPSPQPQPSTSAHRVITEEDIIKKLEERMRKDMMRQWREQGAAAVADMPGPDER